ncbi:MAG TPA: thioredoxin family protein [Steroidobacteraceae bacterium]
MSGQYQPEPPRQTLETLRGPAVIDFGTNWCGYCQAAAPLIEAALAGRKRVRHIKVEDGPGRPLGRAYRVKLWPTLVFLRDGVEVARVVRPTDVAEIVRALDRIGAD